jgi:uncharacterized membrane protein YccC
LVGWTFFKAGLLATIFALPCKYYILAYDSDFSYLMLALGLIFIPLALIMANPSTAVAALNFAFVFCYVVKPDNFMTYDLSDSLNTALAVLMGILFGTLAYVYILPPNPQAARRYVTYRIRRGIQSMASTQPIPHFCFWETRMYDRVIRLYDPQNPSGTHTNEWYEAGLGAITLGNDLLRLRYWLQTERFSPELKLELEQVIDAFGRFFSEPEHAVDEVRKGIGKIAQLDPGPGGEGRRTWARALGALEEIDVYLARNPKLIRIEPAAKPLARGAGETEGIPV